MKQKQKGMTLLGFVIVLSVVGFAAYILMKLFPMYSEYYSVRSAMKGLASEPGAHYVLVSTREHGNSDGPVEFRSYRIIDGEVTEEEVTVVPAPESARRS